MPAAQLHINRTTLLFFDSSALIAATGSSNGGSGFLLSLCEKGYLRAIVSQPVLVESERNIRENMKDEALSRYHHLLSEIPFELAIIPKKRDHLGNIDVVGEKDEHVLAGAISSGADFLVSLDRPLIGAIENATSGLKALTPGDFIQKFLPKHPDFPKVR